MKNNIYLENSILQRKKMKNNSNYKLYRNCPDKNITLLINNDYFESKNLNNYNSKQQDSDLVEYENNEYILKIIERTKFLTPDMLTNIFNKNKTFEENNFELLKLASIFGGPLLKTTYSILDSKYVYTNKDSFINKKTLDGFNKASYLICALNNNTTKVIDIETVLNYQQDEFYTLVKVKLAKNKKYKTVNIVLNSNDLKYYENFNEGRFLNIEKIGYLLKRIDVISDEIFSN